MENLEIIRKKWEEFEKEAREIRKSMANWEFINSLPFRLRIALEYYIKTGDLYVASRIAGITIEEFNELRKKANIPNVC